MASIRFYGWTSFKIKKLLQLNMVVENSTETSGCYNPNFRIVKNILNKMVTFL